MDMNALNKPPLKDNLMEEPSTCGMELEQCSFIMVCDTECYKDCFAFHRDVVTDCEKDVCGAAHDCKGSGGTIE